MKNVITYCLAAFMLVWYSLSVIGFDVHTCSDSGETYIATVISGTACDDIHPEHDEEHNEPTCSCCHKKCASEEHPQEHEDKDGLRTRPCCTDDWQMIYLTGVKSGDDREETRNPLSQLFSYADCMLPDVQANLNFTGSPFRDFNKPRPKPVTVRTCQEVYSIWRI